MAQDFNFCTRTSSQHLSSTSSVQSNEWRLSRQSYGHNHYRTAGTVGFGSVYEPEHGSLSVRRSSHTDLPAVTQSVAGHKRKLEALRTSGPARLDRHASSTVPAVPEFGSHPQQTSVPSQIVPSEPPSKKKSSLFGLHRWDQTDDELPSEDDNDDVEDDDEAEGLDEESSYAQLGTKLVFEYEGAVVKLDSEADLVKWQEERRKRWPSNARIAEKQAERQRTGAERRRLLEAAYALRQPGFRFRSPKRTTEAAHVSAADDLQRSARSYDEPAQVKRADRQGGGLPGIALYDSDEASDAEQEAVIPTKENDKLDSVPAAQKEHNAGQDGDEADEAPEQQSSRDATATKPNHEQRACKYYFHHGKCREGDQCAFRHEGHPDRPVFPVPAAQRRQQLARSRRQQHGNGKKGIHQLLLDQEDEASNHLALQVIKYLGNIGFFKE